MNRILMISRSTLLHLRFPFSFFLLPIYFFALALSPNFTESRLLWSLVIIHLLLYPASNGYNSYFDKDEESIGGLKNPPQVKHDLYIVSLVLDVAAILLGWIYVSKLFAAMLLAYGLISKAYSHPRIRLKKYAIGGWLVVCFFQGFYTLLMAYAGINNFELMNMLTNPKVMWAGVLATAQLLATYPITQVYQHAEDGRRGDHTLSRLLGIRGTFYFAMIFFTATTAGFLVFFHRYFPGVELTFLLMQGPVLIFFFYWFWKVWRNEAAADYTHTMWINFLSGLCLNTFFVYLFLHNSNLVQLFN